ncbi:MAG: hypothetical protein WDO73_34405 [Ignavibacteriota bacterium]
MRGSGYPVRINGATLPHRLPSRVGMCRTFTWRTVCTCSERARETDSRHSAVHARGTARVRDVKFRVEEFKDLVCSGFGSGSGISGRSSSTRKAAPSTWLTTATFWTS